MIFCTPLYQRISIYLTTMLCDKCTNSLTMGEHSVTAAAAQLDGQPHSTTVKKILHNALNHFSKYGYTGASVREITHASDVTKPTLYYYFKNKEDLYRKLAETCFEEILGVVDHAAHTSGTTAERIIKVINAYSQLAVEKNHVIRFVHLMTVAPERTAPDVGVALFCNRIAECFKKIVQDGVQKKEVPAAQGEAVQCALYSIFFVYITSQVLSFPMTVNQQTIEQAVKTVLS